MTNLTDITPDPLIDLILRLTMAMLLLTAAAGKLDGARFQGVLAAYRLLPMPLLPAAARLLPMLEAGLGLLWAFGLWRPAAAMATAALLTVYTAAILINLLRGNRLMDCGCGGSALLSKQTRLSWGLLPRNLLLIALALGGGLEATSATEATARVLGAADYLTAAAALLAAALLFAAFNQLLANATAMAPIVIRNAATAETATEGKHP